MISPSKFKNSTPFNPSSSDPKSSICQGENIGNTIILDLKKDIEALSAENKTLVRDRADAIRKYEDMKNTLKDEKLKFEKAVEEKAVEINEMKAREENEIKKQNKQRSQFKQTLESVDLEIKGLSKSLDEKRKELAQCKREQAELNVKNNMLENDFIEIKSSKSKLEENNKVLEKLIEEIANLDE